MEQYHTVAGNSDVRAHEIGPDYIPIEFSQHAVCRHTYAGAGQDNLACMNELAQRRQGLNPILSTTVGKIMRIQREI